MNREPRFAYYLDRESAPVQPGDSTWTSPLPMQRTRLHAGEPATAVRYADYFDAVRSFITGERFRVIKSALSHCENDPGAFLEDTDVIRIFLAKHGAFYQPAKILVTGSRRQHTFVVNAAFSAIGRQTIEREYHLMNLLADRFATPVLPRVFGFSPAAGDMDVPMFIGEWLVGFSEFHITADGPGGEQQAILWDADRGNTILSPEQCMDIYRQAARILTQAYDLDTTSHIARWHHAAGDFILSPSSSEAVDVRLITVRDYVPMVRDVEDSAEAMLDALVVFFILMTMKNRLDRRDGVKEPVLADIASVTATIDGFFQGLEDAANGDRIPVEFPPLIRDHLASYSLSEVAELVHALIDRFPAETGERELLRTHADEHVERLCAELSGET